MKITKNNQNGRSMIEMLGVLAIIGVLSIGAIAGYSKAMFKYKMNKTMDIISHAVARVAELETMNWGDGFELMTKQHMVKYGILPDCDMNYVDIYGDTKHSCPLPLGEVSVYFGFGYEDYMHGEFCINFLQEPFDSCVAFLNSGIYKNVPEDWWTAYDENAGGFIYIDNGNDVEEYVYGKSEFALSKGAKSELTGQDILEACEICKNGKYCRIYWVVRDEL